MPSEELLSPRESILAEELRAAGKAVGGGFAGLVDRIRGTHEAVADRAFGAVGPVAAPVKGLHDTVAGAAYGSTRVLGDMLLRLSGEAAARAVPDHLPGAEKRTSTRVMKGAMNGMYGDRLASEGSRLAMDMTLHVRGLPRSRMAVFIHGLCETEDAWFLHERRTPNYGTILRDELGYTPVYVRYNSGLDIESNGVRLALALEEITALWPVELEGIALIGHSMGGLVARAACDQASATRWGSAVRHVVALGTPHRGAPLEQTVAVAARVLSWTPETRSLAALLNSRSTGIKDLGRRTTATYLPDVDHHFYSAGLTRGTSGSVAETVVGDLLVNRMNAWDAGRRGQLCFDPEHYRHVERANHFDLLGHPAVAEQLLRWLAVAEPVQRP